ncbi:MAG: hypothetical protein ACRDVP_10860 [Acidimicrobiales bacterium]
MKTARVVVMGFALSGLSLSAVGILGGSSRSFLPAMAAAEYSTSSPLPNPALSGAATTGGDVILAGRSPTSELWYEQSTGGTFGGWQSTSVTDAASQPATVVNGSATYVFFRATNNELRYVQESSITADAVPFGARPHALTWNPEQDLGGAIVGNPAAAVDGNGTIIVVALNSAGNVFSDQLSNAGTWTGWIPLDGILVGQLSLATLGGNVYLLGLNTDGLGWTKEWTAGTTDSWGSWTPLGGVFQSGTTLSGASDGTSLHVQGVNSQGILFEATGSASTWSDWTPLDGVLVATPSLVETSSTMFSVGTNPSGELWDRQYTTSWQAWNPLDGILETAPEAVGSSANAYIFALANDGSVWYIEWTGTSFGSWTSLGGELATA